MIWLGFGEQILYFDAFHCNCRIDGKKEGMEEKGTERELIA